MDNQDILLQKLKDEINWQWKWEKLNRYFYLYSSWITWFCSFLILGLAGYQMHLVDHPQYLITVAIALLSALSISLPSLRWVFKWDRRQRFHDKLARKYEIIKIKLETNQIDIQKGIKKFEKIHKKSPEELI